MSNKNVTVQSNTAPSAGISLRTLGLKAPNQTLGAFNIKLPGLTIENLPTSVSLNAACTPMTVEETKNVFDPTYKEIFSKIELDDISKARLNAVERLPEVTIDAIQFSIIKRGTIKKFVIVDNLNSAGPGSINDQKLGPSKNSEICLSCYQDSMRCPGHFGRIPLQELSETGRVIDAPMIDPFYRREIISLLTVICNDCSAVLMTEQEIKGLGLEKYINQKSRLKIIEEYVKTKKNFKHTHRKSTLTVLQCADASQYSMGDVNTCKPNPKYVLDKGSNNYKIEYITETVNFERTIDDIVRIFMNVSDDDAKLLGLGNNKPIDFIMYDVIVLPGNIRGASLYETENESDRMANTYREIIKANQVLKSGQMKKGQLLDYATIQRQKDIIYNSVKNLIDNRDLKAAKGSNQTSAHSLLQGKTGILRASIMARRSDFTGRTVIDPNPTLEFGEISVPMEWASVLTVPETICDVNLAAMNKLLQAGKITHITKGSGPNKGLRSKVTESNYQNFILEYGDRADRWLQNGDYLTLNRMPSLHKQSLMTGKVKLWKHRTLGLHLSYTTPYNADFDGDEMNVHVPQTYDALAEAVTLMTMEMCIQNEQNNAAIMGLVMDAVIGAGLLTLEDDVMDITEWNDYLMMIISRDDLGTLDDRLLEMGIKKYTGKALFSALLPANLYYDMKGIIIKKGILVNGFITKDHVGPTSGTITQSIYNNPLISGESKLAGLRRAGNFLTDATRVMGAFIVKRGFSIGLRDCGFEVVQLEKIKRESLIKLGIQVSQIGEKLTTYSDSMKSEREIFASISNTRNNMGKEIYDALPYDNAFKVMISTKSKGNEHNFTQIAVMVGQQMFVGKRMASEISGGRRALPHFLLDDESLEAHGLVTSSYVQGLSPIEFFFHAYASREGLIDSAVKISDIGTIHREMSVMFQDLKVAYDSSVRDSNNFIIQPLYGGDGMAGGSLQKYQINKRSPFKNESLSINDVHQLAKSFNIKHGFDKVRTEYAGSKYWYQH